MFDLVKCNACNFIGTIDSEEENCPNCNRVELTFFDDKNPYSENSMLINDPKRHNTYFIKIGKNAFKTSIENIRILSSDEIFVFGSNESGIHGAGAALFAAKNFRAKRGVGNGLTGRCYAIPTKDFKIKTLELCRIKEYVDEFIIFCKSNPDKKFLVTSIGCGLAGYREKDIAPMFSECLKLENVFLPEKFVRAISRLNGGE